MSIFHIIWDRLQSENPKFFQVIQYIAISFYLICQVALWFDGKADIMSDTYSSILDDVCASSVTAFIVAQFTKRNPDVSNKPTDNP